MFSFVVMTFVLFFNTLQLLHHLGYVERPTLVITHVLDMVWNSDLERLRLITSLRNESLNVLLPCLNDEKPYFPEDERPTVPQIQAVGPADEHWYTPFVYLYYAWKSAVASLPMILVIFLTPLLIYIAFFGSDFSFLPGYIDDKNIPSLQSYLELSRRELETTASQTTRDIMSEVHEKLESQENRSLEVILDVLNELNDGLTMQQWYEQQKLNFMMEDDLRAAQLDAKHRRRAGLVGRGLKELNQASARREESRVAMEESQRLAQTALKRSVELLGQLKSVRDACDLANENFYSAATTTDPTNPLTATVVTACETGPSNVEYKTNATIRTKRIKTLTNRSRR